VPSGFGVYRYSPASFKRLLAKAATTPLHVVTSRFHSKTYFKQYFEKVGARTIVSESEYVDKDFLSDFAGFYVRCFYPYSKNCVRLHFFKSSFTQRQFVQGLEGRDRKRWSATLRRAYLGFIVVKPLPNTMIGRTCLKTYPASGRRSFPITRPYEASLFGLKLNVDTLAFQEQDSVAAACATSALWSAFQGTGKLFQHHIPSPVDITTAAFERYPTAMRMLPDDAGLTVEQMAQAIRSVNLDPFLVEFEDSMPESYKPHALQSIAYSYLSGHIPVLLIADLMKETKSGWSYFGKHAVTLTGFSLGTGEPKPHPDSELLLESSRIDKFYAHDDQVGPFARMLMDGKPVARRAEGSSQTHRDYFSLSTSFPHPDKLHSAVRAIPSALLVPLYHKIRVPFSPAVYDEVRYFDALLHFVRQGYPSDPTRATWDVHLTSVEELKENLARSEDLRGVYRSILLVSRMPKFIWRARARVNRRLLFDLLYDATDFAGGRIFLGVIEHDEELSKQIRILSRILLSSRKRWIRPLRPVLEWFAHSRNRVAAATHFSGSATKPW
jgi:hypothetical protein